MLFAESRSLPSFIFENNIFDQDMFYIFFRAPWNTSRLQLKPPAIQREHSFLQNLTLLHFLFYWGPFLLFQIQFRIRISNPDPNPDLLARLNPDPHHERSASSWPGTLIKRKQNFPHIQMGSGAMSYMRKCFLTYEEIHKYFHHTVYMRRSLVIYDFALDPSEFLNIWGKCSFLFYQCTVLACLHILFCLYKAPGKAQLSIKPQMHVNQGPGKTTKLNSSLHMILRDINIERRTREIKRSVVFRMGWFQTQSYELHIPYVLKYKGTHWSETVLRIRIRIRRIHMFLSLSDPDPLGRGTDPSIIKQNSKKNIDSYCFVLLYD